MAGSMWRSWRRAAVFSTALSKEMPCMSSRFRKRMRSRSALVVLSWLLVFSAATSRAQAQDLKFPDPYAGHKKVLVVGDLHTGNQIAHDAVSHAMATLERLGRDSGAYIAFIRTDTALVTKGEVWGLGDYAKGGKRQARGRNLDYFDAVVFYTNGETEMSDQQKRDLLAFVHEDGKGFVAVHTATASFYNWPEYGAMVGGYFDDHPWNVFDAPVVVERPEFPAVK